MHPMPPRVSVPAATSRRAQPAGGWTWLKAVVFGLGPETTALTSSLRRCVMEVLFWSAVAIVLYVYLGYPALLAVWARLAPRPVHRSAITPAISIVIAARNEAPALRARIDNLLAADYPRRPDADHRRLRRIDRRDRRRSSASYRARWMSVLLPPGGKARALNAGVAAARHDVLVFADARQTFAPDALRAAGYGSADPQRRRRLGGAAARLRVGDGDSTIGEGVGAYWRYEKWLRRHESLIGSIVGSTGAIHALRRELWQPLPAETILDDVLAPMQAVLVRRRVVFEGSARAYDRVARLRPPSSGARPARSPATTRSCGCSRGS